jgi:hypothetical protein
MDCFESIDSLRLCFDLNANWEIRLKQKNEAVKKLEEENEAIKKQAAAASGGSGGAADAGEVVQMREKLQTIKSKYSEQLKVCFRFFLV